MSCIKTGFWGFIEPYSEYVYGDAYHYSDGIYSFRICQRLFVNPDTEVDFIISNFNDWFDADQTSGSRNSTMICFSEHVEMTEKLKRYLKGDKK